MADLPLITGDVTGFINFTRSNPDYETLLTAAAQESDPVAKQALIDKIKFNSPLRRDEIELFEYCEFDYVIDNPGYGTGDLAAAAYILPGYVADGYINIENTESTIDIGLYVEDGYVAIDYVNVGASIESGFIAYVGEYYNQDGETT